MDIDMLGKTGNEEENITAQIRDILVVKTEPDGLIFDCDSIQTERTTAYHSNYLKGDIYVINNQVLCSLESGRSVVSLD